MKQMPDGFSEEDIARGFQRVPLPPLPLNNNEGQLNGKQFPRNGDDDSMVKKSD